MLDQDTETNPYSEQSLEVPVQNDSLPKLKTYSQTHKLDAVNPSVWLEWLSSAEEAKIYYIPDRTAWGSSVQWLKDQNIAWEGEGMMFILFFSS